MKRILTVNTVETGRNGITGVVFNYLGSMISDNVCMDYVSINRPDEVYISEVRRIGGEVFIIPRSAKTLFSYVRTLYRIVKSNSYDAAHIHGNSHTVAVELISCALAGCKVRIVHAHSTSTEHPLAHIFLSPLFNMLTTHRIACGALSGRFMYGDRPFSIMRNGIDVNRFSFNPEKRDRIRNLLGFDGDSIVIGHVGYFTEVKNHSFIAEVFKALVDIDARYRLVLIGDGPLRQNIISKFAEYGLLDYVVSTGNISNVDEYVNAFDMVLMPSLYEGVPLTLIEQQANGLKCVVSDTISKECNVSGNIKFLPLSYAVGEWARVISELDLSDRSRRSKDAAVLIGQNGYDISKNAVELIECYNNTIR